MKKNKICLTKNVCRSKPIAFQIAPFKTTALDSKKQNQKLLKVYVIFKLKNILPYTIVLLSSEKNVTQNKFVIWDLKKLKKVKSCMHIDVSNQKKNEKRRIKRSGLNTNSLRFLKIYSSFRPITFFAPSHSSHHSSYKY